MSCGQQALERADIPVNEYYASEIDKYAIKVTMANYPNTIQLGSVVDVDVSKLPKIDILMGGSPCQSFSFAGKRKGMSTKDEQEILTLEHYLQLKSEGFEFEGQSYLFWEYMRILNDIRKTNPDVYFLLENVEMGEKWEKILSKAIGVNGIHINSSLVSAQNRQRIYWTNIGMQPSGLFGDMQSIIEQPKDKGILLKDILQDKVDEKYFLSETMVDGFLKSSEKHSEKGTGFIWKPTDGERKANCLRANGALCKTDNTIYSGSVDKKGFKEKNKSNCLDANYYKGIPSNQERTGVIQLNNTKTKVRRLTPIECERLQTIEDNYTQYVSDTQRYKMIENGWTIDVIAYILNYIWKK
jgi:DNA-cytosine methyltransferase